MSKLPPIARFVYKERDTNTYLECGLLWPSKKDGYNPNFAPHREASDGKILMSDALSRVERGEGFINIQTKDGLLGFVPAGGEDNDLF